MILRKRSAAILLALLLLGSAACIDDPNLLSEDGFPMTEAEAEFLGLTAWRDAVLARQEAAVEPDGGAAAVRGPATGNGPAAVPVSISEEVSLTIPCELGGTIDAYVSLEGTYDDADDTGDLTLTVRKAHEDCGVTRNGTNYVLNGWPDLTAIIRVARTGPGAPATLTATLRGAVRIARGDDSGICSIDLFIDGVERQDGSADYTIGGTVCGAVIDETDTREPAG